jgi:hypothetical protein
MKIYWKKQSLTRSDRHACAPGPTQPGRAAPTQHPGSPFLHAPGWM